MPRPNKHAKTSNTMKLDLGKHIGEKKKLKPFTNEDLPNWLTQDKVDILNHPAKRKIFIGGKKTGKTRGSGLKMIQLLMGNKDCYGLALKKYSGNATKRLHVNYANLATKLSRFHDVPEFKKSTDRTYILREKSMAKLQQNQSIEYASFENIAGLAGIEAPNGGYFGLIHIEEPVEPNDSGKIPDKNEWEMLMDIVVDSVERSNEEYNEYQRMVHGDGWVDIEKPEYHFTMNAWDDHPLILEAQEKFPEEEFFEWVKEDFIKNNLKWVYDEENDTLYVRMTKFANPIEAKKESMIKLAKSAIEENDNAKLALIFGLKYEGIGKKVKTYDTTNLSNYSIEEALVNDFKILALSFGWDVDFRRKIVGTPVYLLEKFNRNTGRNDRIIVVGEQEIIRGKTKKGSIVPSQDYAKLISEIVFENIKDKHINNIMVFVDEGQAFVDMVEIEIEIRIGEHVTVTKAVKKGKNNHWDILERQAWLQTAMDSRNFFIDEKNDDLIKEIEKSYKKLGQDKRDESGTAEKNYDCLNSMEYGTYPFSDYIERKGE